MINHSSLRPTDFKIGNVRRLTARKVVISLACFLSGLSGCGTGSRQDDSQTKMVFKTRAIQHEPAKENVLNALLGIEGAVFSFAGGLPDVWLEYITNDQVLHREDLIPWNESLVTDSGAIEEESADKRSGTIVLVWNSEKEGYSFTLRVNSDVGSRERRLPVQYLSAVDGIVHRIGPGGPVPKSAVDVPLDSEVVLLTRTFTYWVSQPGDKLDGEPESDQSPWDPKNGGKQLSVTLKARFPSSNAQQNPDLKQ